MSEVARTFIPWYRAGFAAQLNGAPAAGAPRAALPADVTLRGTALRSHVPGQVAGPGDVVGLDAAEVLRVEPYDGCPDFEPGYFPYVELRHADLPWRFSPFGPEDANPPGAPTVAAAKVRPWLCLAAVRADRASLSGAPSGGLPILTVDAAELPDPSEAWAWAHVQVITGPGQRVTDALTDESRSLARIVAPNRLEAGVRYLACLVPSFAAGRAALAPGAPGGDPLGVPWGRVETGVKLPVYFSWSFTTGAAGSFETLARRLRPIPPPPSVAGTEIATSAPGWGALGSPGLQALMQGALRPVSASEPPPDTALANSLRTAISTDGSGVQLRPPIYGQDYAHGLSALPPTGGGWISDLNTDPRRRIAAGLGAWAVVVEQEALADEAWRQLAAAGLRPSTQTSDELSTAVTGALARHDDATRVDPPPAAARMTRAGGPLSNLGPAPAAPPAAATGTDGGTVAPTSTDARFAPSFADPAYGLLRGVAQEWLLPGAGDVPDDSVLVMESNTAFVEAFLIGVNHALARELAWRRYPIDPTRTMFRTFWTSTGADADVGQIADWPATTGLGSHTHSPDQLVLLLRGALLRRFPTAQIYLSQTQANQGETHLTPNIGGFLGTDIVFAGFPLTPAQALATTPPWSIVIQESVHHARFGVRDAPSAEPATLATWHDLDWGNPQFPRNPDPPAYAPIAGPLLGNTHPISPDGPATATWGASAGHQAVILQQPAFRVRIPVSLWLTPPNQARN